MRLAGEEELHRAVLVAEDPLQPLQVAEEQPGPLVGGEAPRAADRQRRRGEAVVHRRELPRAGALPRVHPPQAVAHGADEAPLLRVVGGPQLVVGNERVERLPARRFLGGPLPVGAEDALQQVAELGADPGLHVHAVGHRGDRRLGAGEEPLPHRAADLSVAARDGVAEARLPQGEGGHVERLVRGAVHLPDLQQLRRRNAELHGPRAEVEADQLGVEHLVPRGDRRVGGEGDVGADLLERAGERLAALHLLAHPLEDHQRRVPFVDVPDAGVDPQRAQRLHRADAEDHLLAEAHLAPADVEDVRDRPVVRLVLRQVGVEQQHRDASDLDLVDQQVDLPVEQRDADDQRPPVGAGHRHHRQARGIEVGIEVLLAPLGVHRLAEVAAAVVEADGDERQAEVGRRLAVVAGEDAEAAGVDAEALVQAVFGRKIGDRAAPMVGEAAVEPPGLGPSHVAVERRHDGLVPDLEGVRHLQRFPVGRLDLHQHFHRVAVARPEGGGDRREEDPRLGSPAPPEVVGDLAQPRELLRQEEVVRRDGADFGELLRAVFWSGHRGLRRRVARMRECMTVARSISNSRGPMSRAAGAPPIARARDAAAPPSRGSVPAAAAARRGEGRAARGPRRGYFFRVSPTRANGFSVPLSTLSSRHSHASAFSS